MLVLGLKAGFLSDTVHAVLQWISEDALRWCCTSVSQGTFPLPFCYKVRLLKNSIAYFLL